MASYQIVSDLGVPYAGKYETKAEATKAAAKLEKRHDSKIAVRPERSPKRGR